MKQRVMALVLTVGIPFAAHASIVWRGDFETGDRTQWDRMFAASASRLQVLPPPVPNGSDFALRTEVRPGDDAVKLSVDGSVSSTDDMNNRAEVVLADKINEGDEFWYRWQLFVPTDFRSRDDKTGGIVFAQWHHTGGGSPPLLFSVEPDKLKVTVCEAGGCTPPAFLWSEPLVKGHWYTFVLHAVWSSDPSEGLLELWIDNEPRFSEHVGTIMAGYQNYFQSGQYRRPANTETTVLWIDGWTVATERADVLPSPPPPPPPPDAGTPRQPDAGAPTEPDAGTAPGEPDAGTVAEPDAGTPGTPDAGAPQPEPDTDEGPLDGGGDEARGGCSAGSAALLACAPLAAMLARLRRKRK